MPWLLEAADRELLHRELLGAIRERMLREMAEAVEAVTAEAPLVLVLEDLHWSDAATVDLVSLLARHQEPARLLPIATYRPVDVIVTQHPLREVTLELHAKGCGQELSPELLAPECGARRREAVPSRATAFRSSIRPLSSTPMSADFPTPRRRRSQIRVP